MEDNNKTTEKQGDRLSTEQLNDVSCGGHAVIIVGSFDPTKNKNDMATQNGNVNIETQIKEQKIKIPSI